MSTEYNAESRLEQGAWKIVRWIPDGVVVDETQLPTGARLGTDSAGHPVAFFVDQWSCEFYASKHPEIALSALPPGSEEALHGLGTVG
jgi:peptide subunit release factor RF-3